VYPPLVLPARAQKLKVLAFLVGPPPFGFGEPNKSLEVLFGVSGPVDRVGESLITGDDNSAQRARRGPRNGPNSENSRELTMPL